MFFESKSELLNDLDEERDLVLTFRYSVSPDYPIKYHYKDPVVSIFQGSHPSLSEKDNLTLVFPACTYFEKQFTSFNIFSKFNNIPPILGPVSFSRPDADIVFQLRAALFSIFPFFRKSINIFLRARGAEMKKKQETISYKAPKSQQSSFKFSEVFNNKFILSYGFIMFKNTTFYKGEAFFDFSPAVDIMRDFFLSNEECIL